MRKKTQFLLLLAMIAGVVVLGIAPAWAESSDDSATQGSTTSSSSDSESTHGNDIEMEIEQLRTKAKDDLATKRETVKERTQALRQRVCDARQASVNRRVNNYAAAAQRHLDVFTSIFTKVQNFYTNKKLNVTNYDTLVATVKDKQAAAQQAVDVLSGLDVNIDCTQGDPAQQLETVKSAVSDARTALQAYRSSIKDLIVALQGASTAQDNSTTGGEQ